MQAIETKYLGPSNVRGSRVKATCEAKTIILDWEDRLNPEENHLSAAGTLAARLGWGRATHGKLISGQLKSGNYAHVFAGRV